MRRYYFPLVLLVTIALATALAFATYRINFWPTDSELAYIPAATQVFSTPFISHLHHATLIQFNIMHGKEALVVGIAFFQRILNDFEGLFPNILVLIFATAGSGILMYSILRRLINEHAAFLGFFIFITSFWTYQYVIQGAHQPLVMFNFLLSTFLLLKYDGRPRFYFFSGLALGLMLFSSPTAAIYFPYYLAAYMYQQQKIGNKFSVKDQTKPLGLIALAVILVILIFTLPNPVENFRDFIRFLHDSRQGNHFQAVEKTLGIVLPRRGAGLIWVWEYFMLTMPVMFLAYMASILYLLNGCFKKRWLLGLVLLSLSTPIAVELIQVAQFGRNYFSWFIGMILAIAYAAHHFLEQNPSRKLKKTMSILVISLVVGHVFLNARMFLTDVLPSRMATTYMYDWLTANNHGPAFAYQLHPFNVNTANVINHPNAKTMVKFTRVHSIKDAKKGFMLIPIHMGKNIYANCAYPDFKDDPELTKLLASGQFGHFVAASFPTMASSRIWPQEEEYCTYLDLMEHSISPRDRELGYTWILDMEKLHREWFKD